MVLGLHLWEFQMKSAQRKVGFQWAQIGCVLYVNKARNLSNTFYQGFDGGKSNVKLCAIKSRPIIKVSLNSLSIPRHAL